MEKELAGFQLWLSQKGRKPSTIRTISYSLKRVLRSGLNLNAKSVSSYLFLLKEKGLSGKYLNNCIVALRLYGQYKKINSFAHISFLKEDPYLQATMSDEEITAFLSLPCPQCRVCTVNGVDIMRPTDPKRWEKMKVFWSICAFTGMRTGEVAHLTVEDVDWGRNVFVLEDTKTHDPRFVPIPANIETMLHEYIDTTIKDGYLFPSARGGKYDGGVLNNVDWHYDFKHRIKRLGIKRRHLVPYSLRPSFITRLLEEGVDLFSVKKIAGHRRLETTLHYSHLTTKDIQKAVTKHPIIRRSTDPNNIVGTLKEAVDSYALEKDERFNPGKVRLAVHDFFTALYAAINTVSIIVVCTSSLSLLF